MARAANRAAAGGSATDETGRRENAAKRARRLARRKADAMPVVEAPDAPRSERVVTADLADPAPRGGLTEVYAHRYVLRLIVSRQLAQQYAASLLGLLWSYIQPGLRFLVYFFVFGAVLRGHATTPNFALHLFAGMVFVHYFSETWSGGCRSIRQNRGLVLKMRVPRELFPIAAMWTAFYHTGPQLVLLVVACVLVGWSFSFTAILAGLLGFAILVTFSMSLALLFAAFNVYYRDFQNIVSTCTQFLHFLVPMLYPYSMIRSMGEGHELVYQLYMANPVAQAVLFAQRLFWSPTVDDPAILEREYPPDLWERGVITLVVCLLLVAFSQWVFRRLESKFPERL